ncbi:TPA: helix-turn-helix transcriptional regulator [Candidatus Galligastranaerophilus intestinavium]|uniref:Helix-turn-helix transcriptional regulator n=1 Tax=Candidatus Galligastranaerophilus intestinavium TaxID=2840836 RepID=A0A9D1FJ73_9BACT|nr:helix-turn-helix transcriptional regulator [Candidatus Galligastranaerophilus intestinavium]
MANCSFEILQTNIKKYRKEKGLTQLQLAIKCSLSVDHISGIERGIFNPSVKTIFKIAEALNVEVYKFFM